MSIGEGFLILLAVFLGGFMCMSSGALFAYIVFRTKKESHEKLFGGFRQPELVVHDTDPFREERPQGTGVIDTTGTLNMPGNAESFYGSADPLIAQNKRFQEQLAKERERFQEQPGAKDA